MAVCPVNAHLLQPHTLTHSHTHTHSDKATHFAIFPQFQPTDVSYTVVSGPPGLLLWQAADILSPKHSPHIRQGHGLLETYVSHCPCQCQPRATWPLTRSCGRCYHDIRKSPQLTCPSTSQPLLETTDKPFFRGIVAPEPNTLSAGEEKTQEKGGAEVEFGRQALQPLSTHGILGGVYSPAFPLKLVGLAPTITLPLFLERVRRARSLPSCRSVLAGVSVEVKSVPLQSFGPGLEIIESVSVAHAVVHQ